MAPRAILAKLQGSRSRSRDIRYFEFIRVEDVDRRDRFDFRDNWLDREHDIMNLGGTGRLVRRLRGRRSSKGVDLLIRGWGSWRRRVHGRLR
jgi:hypothetical protein